MKQQATTSNVPLLPAIVRTPLRLLPQTVKTIPIQRFLNTIFAAQLAEGELQFLTGRKLLIVVSDAHLVFSLTVLSDKLIVGPAVADPELRIESTLYSLMQLAAGAEDSDTLFFRRHLKMSGDTELGLFVKNFLESTDPDSLPLQPALGLGLDLGLRVAATTARLRESYGSPCSILLSVLRRPIRTRTEKVDTGLRCHR